jgi:ABC-2 type transport system ATP-binding protein
MSGLDPLGRVLVRDLILEERRAGKTVFFSSHILADVEAICDSVAIVVQGRLRGVGPVRKLVGQTVEHVDCVFHGVERDASGAWVRRDHAEAHVRLPPDAVDAAVDAVRAIGGAVIAVVPAQRTLEQVLLDEVERAKPVDARKLGVLA